MYFSVYIKPTSMKRSLLIIFMAALTFTGKSQAAFCTAGAEWRYIFYNGFTPGGTLTKITYAGDSTIGTTTVKVLNYVAFYKQDGGSYCHKALIKQSGDTVFMNSCNTSGTWQILYNFAATAGQQWATTVKDSSYSGVHTSITHTINVLSVSTVTINNMSLKKLQVKYCHVVPGLQSLVCDTASIIERIGCTTYLFNYYNAMPTTDHSELGEFLCYKDNTLGTATFSQKGCDYAVGISENVLADNELSIYPQPVDKVLNIVLNGNKGNYDVKIINILGKSVSVTTSETADARLQVDVASLPAGMYIVQIFDGKKSATRKIIKE
jgi:hypothetical protein